jgi:hypothetical protein
VMKQEILVNKSCTIQRKSRNNATDLYPKQKEKEIEGSKAPNITAAALPPYMASIK